MVDGADRHAVAAAQCSPGGLSACTEGKDVASHGERVTRLLDADVIAPLNAGCRCLHGDDVSSCEPRWRARHSVSNRSPCARSTCSEGGAAMEFAHVGSRSDLLLVGAPTKPPAFLALEVACSHLSLRCGARVSVQALARLPLSASLLSGP